MGWSKKNIIMSLLFLMGGVAIVLPAQGEGAFIIPENRDYYPETLLTLSLENLTINNSYSILIGANQAEADQV